jgi:hypothetical protein
MKVLQFALTISAITLSYIACYLQHVIYRLVKERGYSELPFTPFWLRFPASLGCYPPFLKFIFLKKYKHIGDPRLDRLCSFFAATYC